MLLILLFLFLLPTIIINIIIIIIIVTILLPKSFTVLFSFCSVHVFFFSTVSGTCFQLLYCVCVALCCFFLSCLQLLSSSNYLLLFLDSRSLLSTFDRTGQTSLFFWQVEIHSFCAAFHTRKLIFVNQQQWFSPKNLNTLQIIFFFSLWDIFDGLSRI